MPAHFLSGGDDSAPCTTTAVQQRPAGISSYS
jgi:hypothetical protein